MHLQTFETQFKNSEHYKDLEKLINNKYLFTYHKNYFYNTEFTLSRLEVCLKILFNYITNWHNNKIYFLIVDKFNIVKKLIKEITTDTKADKQLIEDICNAIDNLTYIYNPDNTKNISIENQVQIELQISSIQYKIGRIDSIISYGLWREYYNYGKLPMNYTDKPSPYPYSIILKILLSKKYIKLRNDLNRSIFKIVSNLDQNNIDSDIEISEHTKKIINALEHFVIKHSIYLKKPTSVFEELDTYITNLFRIVLNEEDVSKEYLCTIPKINDIFSAIDIWRNTREEIYLNNNQICQEVLEDVE